MTRIVHVQHHSPHPEMLKKEHRIVLTISGTPGNYRGTFDRKLIITTQQKSKMEVYLRNETFPEAQISIFDYATTGISTASTPIEYFKIQPDKQSAYFELSMLPHQLLNFGFSILIEAQTSTGMVLEYLFCDPQASNDPKL